MEPENKDTVNVPTWMETAAQKIFNTYDIEPEAIAAIIASCAPTPASGSALDEMEARLNRLQVNIKEMLEMAATPAERAYENTINDLLGNVRTLLDTVRAKDAELAEAQTRISELESELAASLASGETK